MTILSEIFFWDECKKSIMLVVCHMPESILWLILQACWPTIERQIVQFAPSISISRRFVSKLLRILQLIRVLPAWIDDHPGKDLKLCKVAPLSCLLVQSIARRIFEHVLPCRRTTLQLSREAFPILIIFQLLQQKYVIQTSLVLFHYCFIWFAFTLSTSRVFMVKKWCAFRQYPHFHQVLPHGSHILLLSSLSDVIHMYWQKNLVFDKRTYIPKLVLSPIQVLMKLLPLVFPKAIQLLDDHTNFVQEVPWDLQGFAHDLGHSCRGRRIQTSGHSDLGILSNLGASSNFTWVQADTASALVRHNLVMLH